MVSSGGTLIACAKALTAAGATTIDAVIVHALYPPEAAGEFSRAGIASVRSANSVAHPTNAIALDEILAAALRSEMTGPGAKS
jgi:ribose-phosphate pyrophosphokinase